MPYNLILHESGEEGAKAVGENIFLEHLPVQYPVYIFYYPAEMPDLELEKSLRQFGERTGNNLLINIGRLDDPQFDKIARKFEIDSFPTLVMTATADLAAPPREFMNTYVRLDRGLLRESGRALMLTEELYLLFLKGEVAEAIKKASWRDRAELLRSVGSFFGSFFSRIGTFMAERDFSVSILEGRFELTKAG